jgi:hypothetical protein
VMRVLRALPSCILPALSAHRSYLVIHRSRELPSSGFDALSNVIFDAAIFHLHRRPIDLSHIIVQNRLLAAIIPFDGDASPICFSDGPLIVFVSIPANAVADF